MPQSDIENLYHRLGLVDPGYQSFDQPSLLPCDKHVPPQNVAENTCFAPPVSLLEEETTPLQKMFIRLLQQAPAPHPLKRLMSKR